MTINDYRLLRKISCPPQPAVVVHRHPLMTALDDALLATSIQSVDHTPLHKLVLLCAPAGYGKTTLLADFAHHTTAPCCWCFLESTDSDKVRFFELLLASIRLRFPQFGATALSSQLAHVITTDAGEILGNHRPNTEDLVDAFAEAVAVEISERFALILCDYHEVNHSRDINHLINRLLQRLPPQCMIIIESRAVPALNLTSLLARRQMLGLGSRELRFTAQEICKLGHMLGIASCTLSEAQEIEKAFDGWVTGILLSTRLGDIHLPHVSTIPYNAWGAAAFTIRRQHLFEYMINEVFSQEPEAYAFLKDAIILKQMSASLCDALLNLTDSAERLAYLEQQGLFVTHCLQEPEPVYVCHPLLRDLLYDHLLKDKVQRLTALHLRAVTIFEHQRDYEQAIYHALAASSYEVAACFIDLVRQQMVSQGYSTALATWIDALPEEVIEHYPRLLLARATIFLSTGEYARSMPLLDKALKASREQSEEDTPILKAEILITQGAILIQEGNYVQAQDLCKQALDFLPANEVLLRTEAHLRKGICACMLSKPRDGIVELQLALALCGHETMTRQSARLQSALANAYILLGHQALSEHHRMRAIQCWEHLTDEWGKLDNILGLGTLKLNQGAYDEAERIFTEVLTTARGPLRYRRGEAYALVNLGELHQARGQHQHALIALEDGLALARQLEDTYLAEHTVRVLATTYLLMGDTQTALALLHYPQQDAESPAHNGNIARALTIGNILLHQHQYREACTYLHTAELALRNAAIKIDHIRTLVRLSACVLALEDLTAAQRYLEEALTQAKESGYETQCRLELCRAPGIFAHIQQLIEGLPPELAQLLLHEEVEHDERPSEIPSSTDNQIPLTSDQEESTALQATSPRSVQSSKTRSNIRILALGEPAVYLDDNIITRWRLACAMEIFFYLLDAERPMHKEQILAAIWPDSEEQELIEQLLRSAIYNLRKLLGSKSIISSSGTYQLDLTTVYGAEHIQYDVTVFKQSYAQAQKALANNDEDLAIAAFEEMIRLYQGDYVQSFYSNWCSSRRYELRHACIDAYSQLAKIAWKRQHLEQGIAYWQHLLTMDNCMEEVHYWLMRCYAQQGKRGLALRQYQHCVTALREELGVSPGRSLQRLYQRLTQVP